MEESVKYAQCTNPSRSIPEKLYNRLNELGLIPNDVRANNIGKSDYSKHTIQPWSIWIDYELNPWDADIVKRILRTKEEPGMSAIEARIMDYDKIEHICRERKRQLKNSENVTNPYTSDQIKLEDVTMSIPDMNISGKDFYATTLNYVSKTDTKPKNMVLSPGSLSEVIYYLKGNELEKYKSFIEKHKNCGKSVKTCFSHEGGIGTTVTMYCPTCNASEDITDIDTW